MQYLFQIDLEVTKHKSGWVCVCDYCQHERIITYSQSWNIKKGNSKRTCRSCQIEHGLINSNIEGLVHGKYYPAERKSPKNRRLIHYRQLFAPELLSNEQMKLKQREAKLGKFGELANRWEGGKTSERKSLTGRDSYKQLRKNVFSRDNYTCQLCLVRGGSLEMDHIKEWCNYPDLRFETTNLRTLCSDCHKKTPNYGSKAKKEFKKCL